MGAPSAKGQSKAGDKGKSRGSAKGGGKGAGKGKGGKEGGKPPQGKHAPKGKGAGKGEGYPRRNQWVSPVALNPEQEARYQAFVRARKAANPDCTRVSRSAWARNLERQENSAPQNAAEGPPPQEDEASAPATSGRVPPPPPQPRRAAATVASGEVEGEEAEFEEESEEETTSDSPPQAAAAHGPQADGQPAPAAAAQTKSETASSGEDTPPKEGAPVQAVHTDGETPWTRRTVRKTTAHKSKAAPGRTPVEEAPVTAPAEVPLEDTKPGRVSPVNEPMSPPDDEMGGTAKAPQVPSRHQTEAGPQVQGDASAASATGETSTGAFSPNQGVESSPRKREDGPKAEKTEPESLAPQDRSWAMDVEVDYANTLMRLRLPVQGTDTGATVLRKLRSRTGYALSCLALGYEGAPLLPLEEPLHLHLPVDARLLRATGSPGDPIPPEYKGPPIVSADLHFCMACQVHAASPEHMQAHMMTPAHVARVAEYVTAFREL